MRRINLHIYPSPITHESRIEKETETIAKLNIVDKIYIIGIWHKGLHEKEDIDKKRTILRIKLWSRKFGESSIPKICKFIEWTIRIFILFMGKRIVIVNIHNVALLPLGIIFKIFKQTKLIYDTHELETEKHGWSGIRKKLGKILEKSLIKYVDEIIVVGPKIAQWYENEYGKKTFVVLNTPKFSSKLNKDLFRKIFNIQKEKIIFLYQGVFGESRGIESIIEAFKLYNANDKALVLLGSGPLEDKIKLAAEHFDNIYYHPIVNTNVLHDYTSSADIAFALIDNSCLNHYYCLPNKFFQFVMAEIPVIVSNVYEKKRLTEEYNIGFVLENTSIEYLIELIKKIDRKVISSFKQNLKAFKKEYNWKKQEEILMQVYKGLNLT